MTHTTLRPVARALACTALLATLSACSLFPQWKPLKSARATAAPASTEALAPVRERQEVLLALTSDQTLVAFNASTPSQPISQIPVKGLQPGEQILGMDFRVAKGQLFALTSAGRLLRIEPTTGVSTAVGKGVSLPVGQHWGVDFNPTVDRLRVVNENGANFRLHPDTGAQVDGDTKADGLQGDGLLSYMPGDLLSGRTPRIVAAAYTYNKDNEKLTTNVAIDAGSAYLAVQGSIEGAPVVVSPNTGWLQSIGPLLIDRFDDASFDISDLNNAAYLVTTREGSTESRLYEVNLGSGQARLIGAIGATKPIRALAIVP
jgi:hypothetical protein